MAAGQALKEIKRKEEIKGDLDQSCSRHQKKIKELIIAALEYIYPRIIYHLIILPLIN